MHTTKKLEIEQPTPSGYIKPDGVTSSDFFIIDNIIQSYIPAATAPDAPASQVFNATVQGRTSLKPRYPHRKGSKPEYRGFSAGDVRRLGYGLSHRMTAGLNKAVAWCVDDLCTVQS